MQTLPNIDEIKKFFPKHTKAKVKIFIIIASCMLQLRTTCLYKCKDKMGAVTGKNNTHAMSHYKTLIRFFYTKKIQTFCQGIFMLIISLLGIESNCIVIDRTNWKIGKKNINLLTAGVLFFNCFIPLCWVQLNKRGNSNFGERKILMNRFLKLWKMAGKSKEGMVIVADREFIGPQWLEYLHKQNLQFVFRLRDNMYFGLIEGTKKNANYVAMQG